MRQAGRYLPEYIASPENVGSVLDLCFTPKLAAEVTLQPIRRFGFDAAILFSDILVVPHALGRTRPFTAGEGPQLEPLDDPAAIDELCATVDDERAGAGLRNHRAGESRSCRANVALLGFCGAPWTVATYMVAGHGTPDQAPARLFAYRDPEAFGRLIDILVEASIDYLVRQFAGGRRRGADFRYLGRRAAAGRIRTAGASRRRKRIVADVRTRNAGREDHRVSARRRQQYCCATSRTLQSTPSASTGLVDLRFARDEIQSRRPVQGNLDPLALLAGGAALDRGVDAILEAFRRRALHLQSRPRHPAGDADRACRADAKRVRGMTDDAMYQWLIAFHIIAVIAWMAGMLYLPRLFVYHCEADVGSMQSETFKVMERRLLKAIINPAMIATWLLGLWLAWQRRLVRRAWLHAKFVLVIAMTGVHGMLSNYVREFAADRHRKSQKFYRILNEVPTVLMILIVILVVVKPF